MQTQSNDASFVGYRRRIELIPFEGGMQAGLEDDFHRFTLKLTFEGDRVSAVEGTADRTPWTPCPGALPYLIDAVRGRTFDEVQAMERDMDHCTHLLDLAVLATADPANRRHTRFDMTVADPVEGRREARLYRDGALVLDWTLAGDVIDSPAALAGRALHRLRSWVDEMPAEFREPAFLLRRACFISGGRALDTNAPFDVAAHRVRRAGVCFTYTGDRLQDVARKADWREDFSARPEALLANWPPSAR